MENLIFKNIIIRPTGADMMVPNDILYCNGPCRYGGAELTIALSTTSDLNERLNKEAVEKGWYTPCYIDVIYKDKVIRSTDKSLNLPCPDAKFISKIIKEHNDKKKC